MNQFKKEQGGKWRIFVAVPLPSELKKALEESSSKLREFVNFRKWVFPEDYHITLQFLGDTNSDKIEDIAEALGETVSGRAPFELKVVGRGVFGKPDRPSILWAGVQGELEQLTMLQREVVTAMTSFGYVPEQKAFHPHVTLARKYEGAKPLSADDIKGEEVFGSWQVNSIVLYRTRLGKVPMYENIGSLPLLSNE